MWYIENLSIIDEYQPYLMNYNTANMCWDQLLKKYPDVLPNLHHAFEDQSAKHTGHKVPDILIMPIQRIPRYIMLLEQLKKFSIPGTVEQKYLVGATEKLQSMLTSMNSQIDIERVSKMEKVINARNSMVNASEDIFPTNLSRNLIKEGLVYLSKCSNPDKKKNGPEKNSISFITMII